VNARTLVDSLTRGECTSGPDQGVQHERGLFVTRNGVSVWVIQKRNKNKSDTREAQTSLVLLFNKRSVPGVAKYIE